MASGEDPIQSVPYWCVRADHEKSQKITPGATLVIPTTGNLGISLALLAQKKGYRVIAVIPERTTFDRIHLLKALGVEILRSPSESRREASESSCSVAEKLAQQLSNAVVIDEVFFRWELSWGTLCHARRT